MSLAAVRLYGMRAKYAGHPGSSKNVKLLV